MTADQDVPRRGRGRRKNVPDTEVKTRMFDAVEEFLSTGSTGLRVGLDHIPLEKVIQLAGTSRSAVYRLWPTKEDFQFDLLMHLAGPGWQGDGAFDQETLEKALEVLTKRPDELETAAGRRALLTEVVRISVEHNFKVLSTSAKWSGYLAILASADSLEGEDSDRIHAELRASTETHSKAMTEFIASITKALGLRLKTPFTDMLDFHIAASALIEGLSIVAKSAPNLADKQYQFPSRTEPWSLAAIGYLAILDAMLEPDPDFSLEAAKELLGGLSPKA